MSGTKRNYEAVVSAACEIALDIDSLETLAKRLDVPRKSLERILLSVVEVEPGETIFAAFKRYVATVFVDAKTESLVGQLDFYKRRAKALKKQIGNRQSWFDELQEIVSVLQTRPVPVPDLELNPKGKTDHVIVLDASDWHYGADTVSTGQLGIFPVYDPVIATAAINAIFERTVKLAKKWESYMNVVAVVLNMKGDLVEHAFLRDGHRGRVAFGPPRQVFELVQILNANIKMLAEHFPKVHVTCVGGNHGRSDKKFGAGLPNESYDWLVGKTIGLLMENQPNVEVYVPDCWYVFHRIWNSLMISFHGENIRSWAGIPWYGIKRAVQNVTAMTSLEMKSRLAMLDRESVLTVEQFLAMMLEPDVVSVGHFHTPQDWLEMGINVVANGALIGVTEHSAKNIQRTTMPCQKVTVFSKKHRLPVLAPNIWADDIVRMQGQEHMPEAPIVVVA